MLDDRDGGTFAMNRTARLIFLLAGPPPCATYSAAHDKLDTTSNGDMVLGPDYEVDPDLKDKGNPKGQSFEFSMALADSKIFRGDDTTLDPKKKIRKPRKIFVYVPA